MHVINKKLVDETVDRLLGSEGKGLWRYDLGSGCSALVFARVVPSGERTGESDGFCGYDWMVASIIRHNRISPTEVR